MEKKIILEQPMEIEKKSFSIIEEHLQGVTLPDAERSILKRVIHTTADFDYIQNLVFSETAVSTALEALQQGADIVTDTNMALSGINKRALQKLGGTAHCFMADEEVAAWLQDTMLLEVDTMTEDQVKEHIENVKSIVNEYKDIVTG